VHPGLVEAAGGRGAVVDALTPLAKDKPALFAGVSLLLANDPESDFLRGGYLSVNWDIDELKTHREEILEKKLTQLGFLNAELRLGGYPWAEKN
jgi:hypothetical protein